MTKKNFFLVNISAKMKKICNKFGGLLLGLYGLLIDEKSLTSKISYYSPFKVGYGQQCLCIVHSLCCFVNEMQASKFWPPATGIRTRKPPSDSGHYSTPAVGSVQRGGKICLNQSIKKTGQLINKLSPPHTHNLP